MALKSKFVPNTNSTIERAVDERKVDNQKEEGKEEDQAEDAATRQRGKKDEKNRKDRERRAAKKRDQARAEAEAVAAAGGDRAKNKMSEEDDLWDEPLEKKKKAIINKSARRAAADIFIDDNDYEDPPKRITIYFTVKGPQSLSSASRSRSKAPSSLSMTKGPFFHEVTDSYTTFKRRMANALPCNADLLATEMFEWTFDKPINAEQWWMPNEMGYDAMIASASAQPALNCVIFVWMAPPSKDMVSMHLSVQFLCL